METAEVKRAIQNQEDERRGILESERIIEREAGRDFVERSFGHPNIVAVLGPRRCGKSVFSWRSMGDRTHGYINFDDPALLGMKAADLEVVMKAMYELYGTGLGHIILDEPQNVKGWELFVSRLRGTKRVIITGSNATLFSGELSSRLTGRHSDFTLHPFSFREHLTHGGIKAGVLSPADHSTATSALAASLLTEYMRIGGFPEVRKFGTGILKTLFRDIVKRDVRDRHGIRRGDALEVMAKALLSRSSMEFTYSRLKTPDGARKVHTVREWVRHLRDAGLVYVLNRFSFKLKQQEIAPRKVHCTDTGMLDAVAFTTSGNRGLHMETLVAAELFRRRDYWRENLEIYYWKDARQREVDFVLKEGPKVVQLIQCCYDPGSPDTHERETSALLEASHQLRCRDLLVLTWEHEAEEAPEGRMVRFLPLWKWLMTPPG